MDNELFYMQQWAEFYNLSEEFLIASWVNWKAGDADELKMVMGY